MYLYCQNEQNNKQMKIKNAMRDIQILYVSRTTVIKIQMKR